MTSTPALNIDGIKAPHAGWLIGKRISLRDHSATIFFPGLVAAGEDSSPRGRGFEFQHRILDGHFFVAKVVLLVSKDKNKGKKGRACLILIFSFLSLQQFSSVRNS